MVSLEALSRVQHIFIYGLKKADVMVATHFFISLLFYSVLYLLVGKVHLKDSWSSNGSTMEAHILRNLAVKLSSITVG